MSKRAEEKLCEACCRHYNKTPDECGYTEREMQWDCPYFDFIERGYEQAEKDILSKITKEHLEGLKWIERTGITSQPYPYHKYCKDLRKTLEILLNDD